MELYLLSSILVFCLQSIVLCLATKLYNGLLLLMTVLHLYSLSLSAFSISTLCLFYMIYLCFIMDSLK